MMAEQGVGKISWLSLSLVVSSVMIIIILGLVFTGNSIRDSALSFVYSFNNALSSKYIEDLANEKFDRVIPSATAYSIITSHATSISDAINAKTGVTANLRVMDTDLLSQLSDEVQLQFEHHINGSSFVVIHDKTCAWSAGYCTCDHASMVNDYINAFKRR